MGHIVGNSANIPPHDLIVVGGGHAGIEAAIACARLGARAALVTHARSEIGRMPCNPAIGGLGKGHLVRELDVLGGEMGRVIDRTGIQFRILNRRKGPAVRAPRAQADKHRYQEAMAGVVAATEGLTVIEGDAVALLDDGAAPRRRVTGVQLADGRTLRAGHVILCTGTFLRGLMHVGTSQTRGGREGAASSEGLSPDLRRLGLTLRRLKTGTPPRLHADSIDTSGLEPQPGDTDVRPFSFRTRSFAPPSHLCWLASTNERTHAIIRANLHRSPLHGGVIDGLGPRYCPSIEDKVVRFADRDRHLVFLEPEGLDTDEIYVNGISTSLPADVQEDLVHSIAGLEHARLTRYGYAVEYDSVPSWQVTAGLVCKTVDGLSLAGQILGTSGYEEAAAQGLVAAVNAVRRLGGGDAWVPGRDEAYIGVLVDDLATKDITEPYRMFTSRAEHRLELRCDNPETRLLEHAAALGLLPGDELARLRLRRAARDEAIAVLEGWRVPDPAGGANTTAAGILRRPDHDLEAVFRWAPDGEDLRAGFDAAIADCDDDWMASGVREEVTNTIKYSGYINKHRRLLVEAAHLDALEIPPDFDYETVGAMSRESREKLARMRPQTLGQASRIDGVRAGDLAILSVLVRRSRSA
jgi:tRNA uridine 5-carboxymethylaminomethyl modification enzyme